MKRPTLILTPCFAVIIVGSAWLWRDANMTMSTEVAPALRVHSAEFLSHQRVPQTFAVVSGVDAAFVTARKLLNEGAEVHLEFGKGVYCVHNPIPPVWLRGKGTGGPHTTTLDGNSPCQDTGEPITIKVAW